MYSKKHRDSSLLQEARIVEVDEISVIAIQISIFMPFVVL